jgi:hypothetical protein
VLWFVGGGSCGFARADAVVPCCAMLLLPLPLVSP